MIIAGLGPGAQVIILQALSAYSAIVSAYWFARPVLRGQALSMSKAALTDVAANDAEIKNLVVTANQALDAKSREDQPRDRRANNWGSAFLVASILLLSAAVLLQIATDPLFNPGQAGDAKKTDTPASK